MIQPATRLVTHQELGNVPDHVLPVYNQLIISQIREGRRAKMAGRRWWPLGMLAGAILMVGGLQASDGTPAMASKIAPSTGQTPTQTAHPTAAGQKPLEQTPTTGSGEGELEVVEAPGEKNQVDQPPVRPSWISAEEADFLNKTGGLQPVATYDGDTGLVTIKVQKAGLTADQIFEIAIGATYDYYKRTDLVETSFRGTTNGKNYLFTGTVAKKYVWGQAFQVAFVPVVTQLSEYRDDEHIKLTWEKPTQKDAEAFLQAHKAELQKSMKGAGVETSMSEYLEHILKNLPDTDVVWGQHDYYLKSGYYLYQQKVKMTSAVANLITAVAGEDDLKGAALKVAYQVMWEPTLAGAPNAPGPAVTDMRGATIHAGR